MREEFTIKMEVFQAIDELPAESQGRVYRALAAYELLGEEPDLEGAEKAVLMLAIALCREPEKRRGAPKGNRNACKDEGQSAPRGNNSEPIKNNSETIQNNSPIIEFNCETISEQKEKESKEREEKERAKEKEEKEIKEKEKNDDDDACVHARWLSEFFDDRNAGRLEALAMSIHGENPGIRTTDDLRGLAALAVTEWELTAKRHDGYSDFARHLIEIMRRKARAARNEPTSNNDGKDAFRSIIQDCRGFQA